ncbi:meiotic recombination protein SPO11 [Topomyia yanbarensis]|uniref:meiotic recombination protein SPO11 n=1 Tax=Topomyia yanbarensis TaxID=2498891 RepID=UPI00273CD371|nr:meiotic recombination protein SPO11 [Topomyia yanbarensis]
MEYLTNSECASVRQKELISAIIEVFQRLSQLELKGSKLSLQVKPKATWDVCFMEDDILTRRYTPDSVKTIHFNRKNGHRFLLVVFLLSEIFKLLATQSSCTKRELYYRNIQLTHNQQTVDEGLRDVCFLLKADLWELNVFSSSKGLVAGPLQFRSKHEEMVDCFNSFGTPIPSDVNGLVDINVTADLVLIVEKDTVFRRLLDDGILERLSKRLIIITSKGYPDVSTRLLLKKIWNKYKTPMYALVDADPYGIEIYCVYKFGSLVCLELNGVFSTISYHIIFSPRLYPTNHSTLQCLQSAGWEFVLPK